MREESRTPLSQNDLWTMQVYDGDEGFLNVVIKRLQLRRWGGEIERLMLKEEPIFDKRQE
jgi:hypothetical protein